MNEATRNKVTSLLNAATFGGFEYQQRMAMLDMKHRLGDFPTVHYMQLVDAVNTQHQTGSYEGCIIWRNAEAKPLPDTLYERRFSDGDQQREDDEVNRSRTEEHGRERRAEFQKHNKR